MSRLIIKNIPKQISELDLKKHFEKMGIVTDCRILFKEKKNRRIAFIGYKSEEDAKKAKEYYNNTYVFMSRINVDFAKTADDPNLPRSWSKYSKDSSAYMQKYGVQRNEKGSKSKKAIENAEIDQIPQDKKEKFREFLSLMKKDQTKNLTESFKLSEEANERPKKKVKKNETTISNISGNKVIISDINTDNVKAGVSSKKVHIKFGDESTNKGNEMSKEITKVLNETKLKEKKAEDKKKEETKKDLPVDEKRLYVLNLPFGVNEEEVRSIFHKYGTITEIKMPKDKEGKFKGFAYISYGNETEALRAFSDLDNKIIMGRILHVRPAFVDESKVRKEENKKIIENEKSSYKRSKKRELLEKVNDPTNWNSLFLNPNTILGTISEQYNIKKRDILEMEASDQAVRVALAETQILNETKEYLLSQNINLDFLNEPRDSCQRSSTTLLIKNISYDCKEHELKELLDFYGVILKFLLPSNKALGIVEFANENFAKNCMNNLSYYKFKGEPLYLEWAPANLFAYSNDYEREKQEPKENLQEIESDDPIAEKILYIKNINFSTSEEDLKNIFLKSFREPDILSTKIVKKNGLSQGYGFIEFQNKDQAAKALKIHQNSILDGHVLKFSISKRKITDNSKKKLKRNRADLEATSKVLVRNIAFEATKQDLKDLFNVYGEVKNVRLPKKMDGHHRGFGFVEFKSIEEAKSAMNSLKNTHLYGRKLNLEWAKEENHFAKKEGEEEE